MTGRPNLLVRVLRDPGMLGEITLADWDLLIRQARAALLLGHLYYLIQRHELASRVPQRVLQHAYSVYVVSERQHESVRLETDQVRKTLDKIEIPLVLLKGAAYIVAGLSVASGRLISDIDLLVPKAQISRVETHLTTFGWYSNDQDEYDQRYYREWMHEIPPVQHEIRKTVLDIHHTILPPTSRYALKPEKLFATLRGTSVAGVLVLSPEDMLIHSVTHLFHEGELEHGLRDLVDIHQLLNHFGEHEPGFWDRIVPRAIELDLVRPLYYGMHYADLILGTVIPEQVSAQARAGKPGEIMSNVMDVLFMHALMPGHPSCDRPLTGVARWLLYVRSHYLRMPLRLLVPHLVRKAWKRRFDKPEALVPVAGEEQ